MKLLSPRAWMALGSCLTVIGLVIAGAIPKHVDAISAKYRVQRVSPAGTVHGEWIVESESFPLIEAAWDGNTFVKTLNNGQWSFNGVFAPPSWLLNVTEEKERND